MLPRVRELEERFADVLTVIGVHAGKYTAERKTDRIRRAVGRLRVEHPVVNDRQLRIWRSYAVQAWPTIAIIAPDGDLLDVRAGEFATEEIAGILERAAAAYASSGALKRGPGPAVGAPGELPEPGPLRYPGRLTGRGHTLYVSDTGHDRVLELRLLDPHDAHRGAPMAVVERQWGCGEAGFADGALQHTCFHMPQGLALHGETLYVADRANHAVRAIDLGDGGVTTVAGTGSIGAWGMHAGPGPTVALRSPWGLGVRRDTLVIGMAGAHQLWGLSLDGSGALAPLAGTGSEAISDGPALAAHLAQPTGVSVAGSDVAFADCESSSVRVLDATGRVRTLVGTGLFDWGDRDAAGEDALLEHAEDLAWHEGALIVADTYNDKLKRVDPATRACAALPGDAGSGQALTSPAGVASVDGVLYAADTDAHRIVRVDAVTGEVRPLEID